MEYKNNYPDLFHAMYRLEGTIDHLSQHAAGVLIMNTDLVDSIPVYYDDKENMLVSCYDKYTLEELGMYKFDILKLSTLNIIDNTLKLIKEHKDIDINLDDLDLNDINVYNDLCKGNVFGIFQLDLQAETTKQIKPQSFDALTALNAIIRPKHIWALV